MAATVEYLAAFKVKKKRKENPKKINVFKTKPVELIGSETGHLFDLEQIIKPVVVKTHNLIQIG